VQFIMHFARRRIGHIPRDGCSEGRRDGHLGGPGVQLSVGTSSLWPKRCKCCGGEKIPAA
jgi:hypothetical protein